MLVYMTPAGVKYLNVTPDMSLCMTPAGVKYDSSCMTPAGVKYVGMYE